MPTSDFLRGTSLLTWAQNPKSDSFTCSGARAVGVRGAAGGRGSRGVQLLNSLASDVLGLHAAA